MVKQWETSTAQTYPSIVWCRVRFDVCRSRINSRKREKGRKIGSGNPMTHEFKLGESPYGIAEEVSMPTLVIVYMWTP